MSFPLAWEPQSSKWCERKGGNMEGNQGLLFVRWLLVADFVALDSNKENGVVACIHRETVF